MSSAKALETTSGKQDPEDLKNLDLGTSGVFATIINITKNTVRQTSLKLLPKTKLGFIFFTDGRHRFVSWFLYVRIFLKPRTLNRPIVYVELSQPRVTGVRQPHPTGFKHPLGASALWGLKCAYLPRCPSMASFLGPRSGNRPKTQIYET